jgi:hypothetical protein
MANGTPALVAFRQLDNCIFHLCYFLRSKNVAVTLTRFNNRPSQTVATAAENEEAAERAIVRGETKGSLGSY